MKIEMIKDDVTLNVKVTGSLNTKTAPELEGKLNEGIEDVKEVVLDFKHLEYISSAGLRVILTLFNKMDEVAGNLIIRNCQPGVLEVFDMTGFSSMLRLE